MSFTTSTKSFREMSKSQAIDLCFILEEQRDKAIRERDALAAKVARVVDRMSKRDVDHRHPDEQGAGSHLGMNGRAYYYAGDVIDDISALRSAVAGLSPTERSLRERVMALADEHEAVADRCDALAEAETDDTAALNQYRADSIHERQITADLRTAALTEGGTSMSDTLTNPNPTDHAYYVDMAYNTPDFEVRRLNGTVTITPTNGEAPIVFEREHFGPVALMFTREGETTRVTPDGDDLEAGDMG